MPPRYSYKNITSCDVCSQIMKGNTRQGLKCKLCRMNVHPECQDRVVKCQPKAKFSRMKSGSEMGDDEREMSIYHVCKIKLHAVCPGLSARGSVGPDQRRQNFVSSKPGSQESHALPQLLTPPPPGAVLLTAAIPPCYSPVRRWRAGDGLLAHQAEDGRVLLPLHGRGAALAAPARPHHRHQVPPPLSKTP